MDYRYFAACRDVDPEAFFPVDERPGSAGVLAAKVVCAGCPVRDACLVDSLARGDEFGVFGGLAPDERRAVRRTARASA